MKDNNVRFQRVIAASGKEYNYYAVADITGLGKRSQRAFSWEKYGAKEALRMAVKLDEVQQSVYGKLKQLGML